MTERNDAARTLPPNEAAPEGDPQGSPAVDWGLPSTQIEALLRPLRGRPGAAAMVTASERDELFARILWSVVVEPGDSTAGALIDVLGVVAAAALLRTRPTAAELVAASGGALDEDAAEHALGRWLPRVRATDVVRAAESAARCHAHLVVPGDADWPDAVDDLEGHRPHLLWVRGDTRLLARASVAIVGARAATGYGEHVAMEFAAGLAGRDVVVVSGGAYGIDGMAHRATLASGGATVAVLAGGIDRLYPSGHEALLTRIAEQGALVSEVPCGTAPTKWRFLQRNRLIAVLARATVVIEAGYRSGALNTARNADDLSRDVGVVPGPITSAASAGCHRLLRSGGAVCVTSVPEVMQLAFGADGVLAGDSTDSWRLADPGGTRGAVPALHTRVLDALRPRRGQSAAELARATGEEENRVRAALGELQLEGQVERLPTGGWIRMSR